MSKYLVAYYRTARGGEPVRDFVEKQDKATVAKINRFRELLKNYGPNLGMPHSRHIKNGLYELRVRGKNEVRIFYIALTQENTIFLLHAFKKRSQELPKKEIEIARARQKELTTL